MNRLIFPVLCVLTDLHFNYNDDISYILPKIQQCNLLIFNGDILNYDSIKDCPPSKNCTNAVQWLNTTISMFNKPFLFTLGNHDSITGPNKTFAAPYLGRHPLHIGKCNKNYTSCVYKDLSIAMLYSGSYHCPSGSYYGCPTPMDAKFINEQLDHINLLFTHIPPPIAAFVEDYTGIKADWCDGIWSCGWSNIANVLPSIPIHWHLFGHDHNNLYTGQLYNTTYSALLKSGKNSYGPCFSNYESGFTTIKRNIFGQYKLSHILFNGTEINMKDVPHGDCQKIKPK